MKKVFEEEAQSQMKQIVQMIFDESPDLGAIIWTQYSPYFNDGDECVFSVHEISFTNATEPDDLDEIHCECYDGNNPDIWAADLYDYKHSHEDKKKNISIDLLEYFNEFIQNSDIEDVMEMMFGNHVKVIATRDGFNIEQYDHE
ncbi:MAG: hypothetical protein PHC28_04790 [Flavobacterium sp.]|nr:hypothetical protein [Flavobacterium sp.]